MRLTATAVLFALILPGASLADANGDSPSRGAVQSVLNVPFVPQSKALCGGACLAMVMRYHGTPELRAGDFADYLAATGGVTTASMVRAADAHGYDAEVFCGDVATLRDVTSHDSPVIVLIDASARLLHYVVVVGVSDDGVVYHDPARRPGITESLPEFERRWAASGRWALRLTQRAQHASAYGGVAAGVHPEPAGADTSAARLVADAARAFREQRWSASRAVAEEALALDSCRVSAWHVLGAAHYMLDEPDSALSAWNQVGAPTLDLVRVDGLSRTRHAVISGALELDDDQMLTARSLALARRRVSLVPAVSMSRVDYRPMATGRADVDVALRERPLWPRSTAQWGVIGVRAITERAVTAAISSPTGGGEIIEASYRWWENRPRAELALTTPELFGWQGRTRIAFADEVQTYAGDARTTTADSPGAGSADRVVETTREGTVTRSQWLTPAWMVDASAGYHHVRQRGNYASIGSALMWAAAHDGCRVRAGALLWERIDDGEPSHGRLDISADQRAELSPVIELATRAGWSAVDAAAPRSLWPGAGTGQGREMLLRAHPLLDQGVITGSAFAPSLLSAGAETTRWMVAGVLGAALFTDAAVPVGGAQPARLIVDAGVGARLHPPGEHGYVRIDIAAGLTERTHAISVAWVSGEY